MYYVYRFYYNADIVYVGRTNNIDNRIRQHILSGKVIDVNKVSKIEIAKLDTEADMNLYELYYILKYKPILNIKDATKDELTIELEELQFIEYYPYLYENWKYEAGQKQLKNKEKQQELNFIKSKLDNNLSTMEKEILSQQYANITGELYGEK